MTEHPILLMGRNLVPEAECKACEKQATHLCLECIYEHEEPGLLCDDRTEGHPHMDSYGEPMPFVNSPRVGVCGYVGPAEPPY